MKNLNYLNQYRIDLFGDGFLGDEHNGAFEMIIRGEKYRIIASDGADWEHVSISHKNKIPSWNTMCALRYLFFENEEVVMQLHPKKSEYINCHPNCLHLWKPIGREIPTPPKELVGI